MFFILGYRIFRNFGIWDIGIYFGIQVKLIFGIWDIFDGLFWISGILPTPLTKPQHWYDYHSFIL